MIRTYFFSSDVNLGKELLKDVKNRVIEQKHFYTGEGAQSFIDFLKVPRPTRVNIERENDYFNFITEYILQNDFLKNKKEKCAFISLGCGDAQLDKKLLEKFEREDYSFNYFGVDLSHEILEMARKNWGESEVERSFICADFASHDFIYELKNLLRVYPKKIFAFLGLTIGNIKITNIIDTFYNLCTIDDLLWNDVVLREGTGSESDIKLFDYYASFLDKPETSNFFYNPLERLGISLDSGRKTLNMIREESVGALKFQFGFQVEKKSSFIFRGEKITLLPGENFELVDIRAYAEDAFVEFMEEHNFSLIGRQIEGRLGKFLFKRR